MKLHVVEGDIATLDVDAVVNAANTAMRGGGGVDGAIHAAAGRGLLAECIERFPDGLPTGGAGWTHGHRLAARWVIHVVGPVYDGTGGNRNLLVSCYRNALGVGDELQFMDAQTSVVGVWGESPLRGAILGSTPHKLLQLSDRPVLCVPPPSTAG